MQKNKLSLYFIFVSVLTFLTVFFSIVQKSYFNFKKPQELVENNDLLKEINPNLDLSVISTIESKNKNTDEAFDFSIIKSGQGLTVEITPTPVAEPTLEPTVTPAVEEIPTETLIEPTP
jgi:hypothetical protein